MDKLKADYIKKLQTMKPSEVIEEIWGIKLLSYQKIMVDGLSLNKLRGINVVKENGEVVASTDFTDESKNLAVWKVVGLQEEDFYKEG